MTLLTVPFSLAGLIEFFNLNANLQDQVPPGMLLFGAFIIIFITCRILMRARESLGFQWTIQLITSYFSFKDKSKASLNTIFHLIYNHFHYNLCKLWLLEP